MLFILSKILFFFLKPIVWISILLLIALFSKNGRKRKPLILTAFILLFVFANSYLVGKVFNAYEAEYPIDKKFDVGIVLGGFSGINERNNQTQFNFSGDRLFQAIKLYKKGKISKILISGGSGNLINTKVKEADLTINYLREIGIPDADILIENQSRNTVENGKNSYAIIQKYKANASVLVITSAWHIPRSKLIFNTVFGKDLSYYPTNYLGETEYYFNDFLIPSADALVKWELILKEWCGLIVDTFRSKK
ncbi:YdcF family protein [Pedobacter nototheniae]|uniref:YdcF family protein n=1 Tax=Pedobacter nototheniae TaxID=2488994 RepID=UPI00103E5C2F|nr:YdcF family protein [Pedobacter nototheniae]